MAKGREKHEARREALSFFGKDLARRAKSSCELCETSGVSLSTFELPPAPKEPDFERCLLLCTECLETHPTPQKPNPSRWRVLNSTVWSETPAAQALAVHILRNLSSQESWAEDLLDQVYLDPEVEALTDSISPE